MEKTKIYFNEKERNIKLIFIALGSNLNSEKFGSPEKNCREAIKELKNFFLVNKISSFYESEAIPNSEQSWFVNCVVEIITRKQPIEVLKILLKIEQSFGRIRENKNEPRIIDLDLLTYNDIILNKKKLILPHPRLHQRNFVLLPIYDLNPNWMHPILKKNVKYFINKFKDTQKIKKMDLCVE